MRSSAWVYSGWAAGLLLVGCAHHPSPAERGGPALAVPSAAARVDVDGDANDPAWTGSPGPARTGPFAAASGAPAVPHTEARFVWAREGLYVLLYAADDDVHARHDGVDSFRLSFTRGGDEFSIDVSAAGERTERRRRSDGALDGAWQSGARIASEVEGTVDDPGDEDEEWVVEMAVPFATLGMRGERGEAVGLSVSRHEVARGRPDSWSAWERHRLVLE
ncbi:MAG TPA: hypothetical protein VKU41_21710 [Polyangiaceae bacterium]|nr:hypothetical protein [Polyangiaceae bacterium]